MPVSRWVEELEGQLAALETSGAAKGRELVISSVLWAREGRGPRVLLEGFGDREFIRMNSNSYLGLSKRPDLLRAEEEAARIFGAGPGAVRFISGTCLPHVRLERALADFHGREAAILSGSAYTAVMGVLVALSTPDTLLVSDELNHNCIVNGMKLAPAKAKRVYQHLELGELEAILEEFAGTTQRAIVVTDGVFSMRGDHAPLNRISRLLEKFDARYPLGVLLVVDDSHGAGAFGPTGRGTEELTGGRAGVLVGTLGKAFGVNGGYACASGSVVRWLREKSPFYIYSNPISAGEAAAAHRALEVVDSEEGRQLLTHLREVTRRFRDGLGALGLETIPGQHPVVPLLVRDTARTKTLVEYLRENGVLATGLKHPVVPRGQELIRFQLSAAHTDADVDEVLDVLRRSP